METSNINRYKQGEISLDEANVELADSGICLVALTEPTASNVAKASAHYFVDDKYS